MSGLYRHDLRRAFQPMRRWEVFPSAGAKTFLEENLAAAIIRVELETEAVS